MKYISTRGEAPKLNFEGAMLSGLARDGGLYVPEKFPKFSKSEIKALRGKSYADVAFAVCSRFTEGSIPAKELKRMIGEAYATFDHSATTPLKQLDANQFLLELFHGPTIAFKDVAMQLLARLMDWSLAKNKRRAVIVAATSGDTGGAAVAGFEHSQHASLFVLHPHGRVSDVQRRQMTTVKSPSVHNIAIEGNFDDCQAIVKALFNDHAFRDRVGLAGVNSINWGRIMAQIVYYFYAALQLGAPDREVSFTVPTGNFGNIFAGLAAKRMGLPIEKLVIATNSNDILDRTLKSGRYEITGVVPTTSPSMDIQLSSNFERLVYLANDRDTAAVRAAMASLAQSQSFTLKSAALKDIRSEFTSGAVNERETAETMAKMLKDTGELLDPHTAIAVHVALQQKVKSPMVSLATAHPAKFPDAVKSATGQTPRLPYRLEHLMSATESFKVLPNSAAAVKDFILQQQDRR
ncbi:threonine synthase [Aestuariivirga litoralis]|uniref:threonine synthase n=1 Tax=Aestuariivirga litoralis TaxID=2650924 RepID=UPI0018C76B85|nr:threonine synthase [Aestuariivirga litoralis]MBG1233417.1 threonine synthase [Aestuariivirga litoralis]